MRSDPATNDMREMELAGPNIVRRLEEEAAAAESPAAAPAPAAAAAAPEDDEGSASDMALISGEITTGSIIDKDDEEDEEEAPAPSPPKPRPPCCCCCWSLRWCSCRASKCGRSKLEWCSRARVDSISILEDSTACAAPKLVVCFSGEKKYINNKKSAKVRCASFLNTEEM